MELQSVRSELKRDPDGVLKAIAEMGCREVEGHSRLEILALMSRIRQYGITVRSCVTETPLVTTDWEFYPDLKPLALADAIDSLRTAGIEFFRMGFISPGARGDGDDFFRRTADRMNAAGELCRKAGLRFAWRNRAFEFQGRPGMRPIDIYAERLDPKLVTLEMDTFWASVAGLDPVHLLNQWKGRVALLHVQDRVRAAIPRSSEAPGAGAFAQPGKGALDVPAILKSAESAGVRYYFAGQDEVDDDPLGDLRQSLAHLRTL